ncbi:hypothetical protein R7O13_28510, partial [Vibrio sp. Y176]|uniref:hypothetical protein n=1 Tax=Vibrio sp. Y176 TaxID=3074704 RepID=UPI00296585D7
HLLVAGLLRKRISPVWETRRGFILFAIYHSRTTPNHFGRFISGSAMLLFSQRLLASFQHITHYA